MTLSNHLLKLASKRFVVSIVAKPLKSPFFLYSGCYTVVNWGIWLPLLIALCPEMPRMVRRTSGIPLTLFCWASMYIKRSIDTVLLRKHVLKIDFQIHMYIGNGPSSSESLSSWSPYTRRLPAIEHKSPLKGLVIPNLWRRSSRFLNKFTSTLKNLQCLSSSPSSARQGRRAVPWLISFLST